MEPIAGEQARGVLRRQGKGKARGADGWGPTELALLPGTWLEALGIVKGKWEAEGHWPEHLRQVNFSMIPKPKAESEAGLRPIGRLPYIYIECGWQSGKGSN